MPIKTKIFAMAASLTLLGGISVTGTVAESSPAEAATASCGSNCVDLVNDVLGTKKNPVFVPAVADNPAIIGTSVILYEASNQYLSEDFSFYYEDPVLIYYMKGDVSTAVYNHYTNDEAYQIEYTPGGVATDMCIGLSSAAGNGAPIALWSCQNDVAHTVWIVDSSEAITNSFVPLIVGNDTNFSDPYVLTAANTPDQLTTESLKASASAQRSAGQLWTVDLGPLQH
jgi:hypothetical protein